MTLSWLWKRGSIIIWPLSFFWDTCNMQQENKYGGSSKSREASSWYFHSLEELESIKRTLPLSSRFQKTKSAIFFISYLIFFAIPFFFCPIIFFTLAGDFFLASSSKIECIDTLIALRFSFPYSFTIKWRYNKARHASFDAFLCYFLSNSRFAIWGPHLSPHHPLGNEYCFRWLSAITIVLTGNTHNQSWTKYSITLSRYYKVARKLQSRNSAGQMMKTAIWELLSSGMEYQWQVCNLTMTLLLRLVQLIHQAWRTRQDVEAVDRNHKLEMNARINIRRHSRVRRSIECNRSKNRIYIHFKLQLWSDRWVDMIRTRSEREVKSELTERKPDDCARSDLPPDGGGSRPE